MYYYYINSILLRTFKGLSILLFLLNFLGSTIALFINLY